MLQPPVTRKISGNGPFIFWALFAGEDFARMMTHKPEIRGWFSVTRVGEHEAMNCLEQGASKFKTTSGDLTAAYSTSLIAMFAHVTNCTKVHVEGG